MKFKIKKNYGFTLIELVIVIIILGILAAIAIPRFLNLDSSARIGVLKSLAADMHSEASMVHLLMMERGLDSPLDSRTLVKTRFGKVETYYFYPETQAEGKNNLDIFDLISFKEGDIHLYDNVAIKYCDSRKVGYNEQSCYVKYSEACGVGASVKIEIVSKDC